MNLIKGDCVKILREMDSESIDLVIIDPPYDINYKTSRRKDKGHDFCKPIANDDNFIIKKVFDDLYRVMKPDTACYIFWSIKTFAQLKELIDQSKFKHKNTIVWKKNNWTAGDLQASYGQQYELIILLNKGRAKFNGKRLADVWEFDKVVGKEQCHQNQKPVKLLEQIVEKHSNKGDTVLDCFMGSGSTGVACKNLNRKFIGIELDENYFNIAKERIDG